MASRARILVGLGTIGALVAAGLAASPVAAGPVVAHDAFRAAAARLVADADGPLTLRPGFVGVPAAVAVDNPAVTPAAPVTDAARAHLPGTAPPSEPTPQAWSRAASPTRWPAPTRCGSPRRSTESPGDRRWGRRRAACRP